MLLLAFGAALVLGAGLAGRHYLAGRRLVLRPDGGPVVSVMDFAKPLPLDPLPPGWEHRKFWMRRAMTMSHAVKDGVAAMRFATANSASMLVRHVDIELADYPILAWRWYVERPIDSALDERAPEGDDHPVRLLLRFTGQHGHRRAMEIIWSNRLKPGQFIYIGSFPHYIADGGAAHVGQWRDERIDLAHLYAELWPGAGPAYLAEIAVFCDSDDTHQATVSYVAYVRLERDRG